MIEKTIEEWVDHIIKRFGKKDALLFATSDDWHDCPCIYLRWKCKSCEYKESLGLNEYWCKEANGWIYLKEKEILEIKRLIGKKLE